ncbi:hypothetical protein [Edaphobacter flagellatus]|uniref:hypothetical protein n=1 Tax=Edaphobacter flagellatus TaxID=1933044 RepID=UPI0021B3A729|nr:hypothetical protein [Edaphobacter flagellatus]
MKSHRLRTVLVFAAVLVTAVVVSRPAVYTWLATTSLRAIEEVNELTTRPLDRRFTLYPCPNTI